MARKKVVQNRVKMGQNKAISSQIREVFDWIENETRFWQNSCKNCGKCCDFASFGHKLYVSSPEMIYFAQNVPVIPMTDSACPYQKNGLCSVYEHRFAGCRIFNCGSKNEEEQAILSEKALKKFKEICLNFDLDYFYTDLKTALNR